MFDQEFDYGAGAEHDDDDPDFGMPAKKKNAGSKGAANKKGEHEEERPAWHGA
jgi:hypothetical protein